MLKEIVLPKSYNYCGVFFTFKCSMGCSYCINRAGDFKPRKELSGKQWIQGLSRIKTERGIPLSLSGGEPTKHSDFYKIVQALHKAGKQMDLLTNGDFDLAEFTKRLSPKVFNRPAKYASIRFSFHKNTWEHKLIKTVYKLNEAGYSVGIWGLKSPHMELRNFLMEITCGMLGIDYREKEFLSASSGNYKYPEYMTGEKEKCLCRPSELLIAPDGYIYRCHRDLYSGNGAYAHILDKEVNLIDGFAICKKPKCNFCDVKIKTNRYQVDGWTAVEIKELK